MGVYSQASMDWDNLKFFLAFAESGSLSRASEKLGVEHSTVARRIDMLENDLGVRVVERLPRSYRLTAEGEQVRDLAREIEGRIADIARVAKSTGQSSRVVRVSGPPTLLSQFLQPWQGRSRSGASDGEASREGTDRAQTGGHRLRTLRLARISCPVVVKIPTIFSATTTASIICRNSVG
jgi:DNA-binding transcriptional LysR family regulator